MFGGLERLEHRLVIWGWRVDVVLRLVLGEGKSVQGHSLLRNRLGVV